MAILAERNGELILETGAYALEQANKELSAKEQGYRRDLSVGVNTDSKRELVAAILFFVLRPSQFFLNIHKLFFGDKCRNRAGYDNPFTSWDFLGFA